MPIWQPTMQVNIGGGTSDDCGKVRVGFSIDCMFECMSVSFEDDKLRKDAPSAELLFYDISDLRSFAYEISELCDRFERFMSASDDEKDILMFEDQYIEERVLVL